MTVSVGIDQPINSDNTPYTKTDTGPIRSGVQPSLEFRQTVMAGVLKMDNKNAQDAIKRYEAILSHVFK